MMFAISDGQDNKTSKKKKFQVIISRKPGTSPMRVKKK